MNSLISRTECENITKLSCQSKWVTRYLGLKRQISKNYSSNCGISKIIQHKFIINNLLILIILKNKVLLDGNGLDDWGIKKWGERLTILEEEVTCVESVEHIGK